MINFIKEGDEIKNGFNFSKMCDGGYRFIIAITKHHFSIRKRGNEIKPTYYLTYENKKYFHNYYLF